MRWLQIVTISLVVSTTASCVRQSDPLSPLGGQPLRAISVEDREGHKVLLTSREDLDFVSSHLAGLELRREFKMSHEFNLEFSTSQNSSLRLRLGETHIGPDVPASKVEERWYFKDRTFYEFIKAKMQTPSSP